MFFLAFLKWVLVLGLLVAGVSALLRGLGVEIPLVQYKGLEARGVPAGLAMLVAAIALAYFWRVRSTRTTVDTYETTSPDSGSTTVRRESGSSITFKTPGE